MNAFKIFGINRVGFLWGVATLLGVGRLPAQGTGEAAGESPAEMTLISLLEKGGWVMLVLAGLSVLAVMLILLYFLTLRRRAVVTGRFMNAAEALLRKKDYLGLVAYCHRRRELVAQVTRKTLDFLTQNPHATHAEIREVAEAEASRQATFLGQRISYLADLAGVAPMVGLLGTVLGMIKSFMDISAGNFEGVKQLQMARGVWEALVTTAAGLTVGIVAMIFYSLFRGRVTRLIAELESASTHLLAILSGQLQSVHRGYGGAREESYEEQGRSPMRNLTGEESR